MGQPAPDAPFDLLSAVTVLDAAHLRATFPDEWQQGRGLFGGLVTSTLIRALETTAPDRALRSLTAELCGPVLPGDAALEVSVLRAGNAVTTSTVRLLQNGEVLAHAVGVMGLSRTLERDAVELTGPKLPPWKDVEVIAVAPPLGPVFAQHFEFRPLEPFPFSGGTHGEVNGWVKPKVPGSKRDAAYLAGCIDGYWPAQFARETTPRPMATVAFTLQPFARFDGVAPDAPYAFRSRQLAVDAGYCVEQRELWSENGRLLALNQQTMVIIK